MVAMRPRHRHTSSLGLFWREALEATVSLLDVWPSHLHSSPLKGLGARRTLRFLSLECLSPLSSSN